MSCHPIKHHVYSLITPWYFESRERILPIEERSLIYGLPDDIVYYMARGMPIADQAAFAMSCKAVWNILNGRRVLRELSNTYHGRMAFLERFERTMPHYYLCYRCKKFHQRMSRSCRYDSYIILYRSDFREFYYSHAKEVMNYYRFGPSHGSPAKEVVYSGNNSLRNYSHTGYEKAKRYIDILCSVSIKEVQENLILKQDIWVTCSLRREKYIAMAWAICRGVGCHFDDSPHMLSDLAEERYWSYRCPLTRSEKRIQALYPSDKPDHAIFRGTIWQNLGSCQNSRTGFWTVESRYSPPCESDHQCVGFKMLVYPNHFDDGMPSREKISKYTNLR